MDISADLFELTRCPVGLVSSGVKSILDIGRSVSRLTLGLVLTNHYRTLEYLASLAHVVVLSPPLIHFTGNTRRSGSYIWKIS